MIDRASNDLLTVESDIAQTVAIAVTGRLLPEERARLTRPVTSDAVAYEEYLRGMEEMNRPYDESSLRSALVHFDRAIARDSGFAAAFASKAYAWVMMADGVVSPREGYGQARGAAGRALALDSSQALPYAMLGLASLALDLDAHEAERLARRAVALDPKAGYPHYWLAWPLYASGRNDEAIAEARRAWELDSLVPLNALGYAWYSIWSHRLDSVAAFLPKLRAVVAHEDADAAEGWLLATQRDFRGATRLMNWRWYGGVGAGTYVWALVGRGDTAAARAIVDSMLTARSSGYYNPIALAMAFAALGDVDHGIEWLRRAFDERTIVLMWVRQLDEFAPLRADPRYAELDRQLRY